MIRIPFREVPLIRIVRFSLIRLDLPLCRIREGGTFHSLPSTFSPIAEKERQLTEREKSILDEATEALGRIHAGQTQKSLEKREKQVQTGPVHFSAQQLEKDQKEQEEAKEIKIGELVAHVRAIANAYSRLQNNNRGQQNWVRELQRMVDGLQKDCTE
ncbi:unnamed protein product [Caenorhabditis brenneri]